MNRDIGSNSGTTGDVTASYIPWYSVHPPHAVTMRSVAVFCPLLGVCLDAPPFAPLLPNLPVFTTAGGVKFIVLKEGTGPVARDGDFCVVEFTG